MEFDWLRDAVEWVADIDWDPTTAIVAVVVTALGTWILGRLNVFTSKRADEWIDARWNQFKSWWAKRRREKASKKAEEERKERLRVLEAERVGKRFLRRASKDDPGQLIKVVGLDPNFPERRVRIQPVGPDPFATVTVIDWKQLVAPAHEQKHLTARFVLRSENDDDGWVTFEPVAD